MRNHLARQVLDHEMLHLMEEYQKSMSNGTEELGGTIDFIKNTSILMNVFSDSRPITTITDAKLDELSAVHTWFKTWETSVTDSLFSKLEITNKLLTRECREDISSLIQGFHEICKKRFCDDKVFAIVPFRMNSDPIENLFCQQRATYHSSSDNPNVYAYESGLSSVILG